MSPSAEVISLHTSRRRNCGDCEVFARCLGRTGSAQSIEALGTIEASATLVHRNDHVYRAGDAFRGLHVVKAGCVKAYVNSESGEEQVLGFYMPGEIIGFDGLAQGWHLSSAVAVGTGSICELPQARLQRLAADHGEVHDTLMNWCSLELVRMQHLVQSMATRSADARLAGFLVDLSDYHARHGYSATQFTLPMLRTDIGRHLGLAVETISRVINRFRRDGLVTIERQQVHIHDLDGLRGLVHPHTDALGEAPRRDSA